MVPIGTVQVWCSSIHMKKIDTQLHGEMRVISGMMKSTVVNGMETGYFHHIYEERRNLSKPLRKQRMGGGQF